MNKRFQKIIGIIGHPMFPSVEWSDEQLFAMRNAGFDTLQLSIAWSTKPANEVLNLEDLNDATVAAVYKERILKAHQFGFSALAHFGIPFASAISGTVPECMMDPEVVDYYVKSLKDFFKEYDADEVMIYTYDQHAWLCSEFGDCPQCSGVPLYERIVPFLEGLVDAVQAGKPGARLWWEPWELSEGQIIEVLERIRPENFGVIMHNSIAEVYFVNTTDLAFRNIARLAGKQKIPFIGECFFGGAGEDVTSLTHIPCPRLVYQQLEAMENTVGVTGIKEYYGLVPAHFSVNIALFSNWIVSPEKSMKQLMEPIAASYGCEPDLLLEAWELVSEGMELFPFNASWWIRFLMSKPELQSSIKLPATDWETPAWKASRKGYYLVTDEGNQHPWLLEDVGLRACAASRRFEKAAALLEVAEKNSMIELCMDLEQQRADLNKFSKAADSFGKSMLKHRADGI